MESEPWLVFSPQGDQLAVAEVTGRLTLWPLEPNVAREPRVLFQEEPERQFSPQFDAEGSRLAWASGRAVSLWRLEGPPSADPVVLRRGNPQSTKKAAFHANGEWLAVANQQSITFWATRQIQPYVLHGHDSMVRQVFFTDDSKWLISCGGQQGVRMWPLNPRIGDTRNIGLAGVGNCNGLAVAPDSERIILGGYGGTRLISVSESKARVLTRRPPDGGIYGVAFDASGQRAASFEHSSHPAPPKRSGSGISSHTTWFASCCSLRPARGSMTMTGGFGNSPSRPAANCLLPVIEVSDVSIWRRGEASGSGNSSTGGTHPWE